MGQNGQAIDPDVVQRISQELKELKELGIEIGIVIGGGNIFRGISASAQGMDRVSADYMGMLATVINSMAMQDFLEQNGVEARVMTAIRMEQVAEPYVRRRALRSLQNKQIVIFAGGTGNPYFSTDTAAALRAVEIEADAVIKGTKVDGVYDSDPVIHKNAKKFDQLTYMEVVQKQLKVMDTTAITLCMDNKIPIYVFNLMKKGNLKKLVLGEKIGTKVNGG